MPHLRLYAVSEAVAETLSETLLPELAQLTQSPLEDYNIQLIQSQFYQAGQKSQGNPQVEVLWFERALHIQNKCAKAITNALLPYYENTDIQVAFTVIGHKQYYINGEHF
ncbi:DUF1904 domain-containing protein [Catenovulum sp. 2E275]|uniref:DUF1904 domain-containing protein n=1 Tax=Catenovulum sp. 2E275 TaxID=2980497 RepID=UPI0021D0F6EB|nr:DUF1904 domain-containing protein [Catenovulum sp. 2E275]MCU4674973.1 DUF1904 domain-containing protein [Catenovulum sp. 2E275]